MDNKKPRKNGSYRRRKNAREKYPLQTIDSYRESEVPMDICGLVYYSATNSSAFKEWHDRVKQLKIPYKVMYGAISYWANECPCLPVYSIFARDFQRRYTERDEEVQRTPRSDFDFSKFNQRFIQHTLKKDPKFEKWWKSNSDYLTNRGAEEHDVSIDHTDIGDIDN